MKTQLPDAPIVFCVRVPARWSTRPVVLAALPTETSAGANVGFAVMVEIFPVIILMTGFQPAAGAVVGFQLAAVFQSVLVPPTQVPVAAKAEGRQHRMTARANSSLRATLSLRVSLWRWFIMIDGLGIKKCGDRMTSGFLFRGRIRDNKFSLGLVVMIYDLSNFKAT